MVIYIVTFSITIILTKLAEINFSNNRKKNGIIVSVIAILIPSILAGIRHTSIGTDVTVYVEYLFQKAQISKSYAEYLLYQGVSNIEIGYNILTFVIAKIFGNLHWLLFFIQLIIITNIYLFLYDKRESISMTLGMFIYLFTFYNLTLNITRQTIAVSFVIYSLIFFERKKYIKTFVLFLLGFSFHSSAAIAIIMYSIILIFDSENLSVKVKKILIALITIVVIIVQIAYMPIIEFLTYDLNIFPEKYINYILRGYNENAILKINKIGAIIRIIFLLLFFINKNKDKKIYSYVCFAIIELGILFMGTITSNFIRIGYYMYLPSLFVLASNSYKVFKRDENNRILVTSFIGFIICFYWFLEYIVNNISMTYPYIIGI